MEGWKTRKREGWWISIALLVQSLDRTGFSIALLIQSLDLSARLISSYELVEGVCYRTGRVGLHVELNGSLISFVVP